MFLQSVRHIQDLAERLENIDADLDQSVMISSGAQRQLAESNAGTYIGCGAVETDGL